MLNYNTITNPGPNLAYNKYLLIPQTQIKLNSNTPDTFRNSAPNLNGVNSYSYSASINNNPFNIIDYSQERNQDFVNENRNYVNENQQQQKNYQNYNGNNSQNKNRLRMAGNNIMN